MENLLNSSILEKVEEIVDTVRESSQYQNYLMLEKKMQSHSKIPKLICRIKELQKKAVRLESQGHDISSVETELLDLHHQLESIPLYCDFISAQEELNEIFSRIKQSIESLFQF